MTDSQIEILVLLGITLALFVWEKIRFDLVALSALLAAVVLGLVDAEHAFSGFGNPAVITVAAVLVIGHALGRAGIVDVLATRLSRLTHREVPQTALLCMLGAALSAFMNNVGALMLVMPIAIQAARSHGYRASSILMPLSFATLLGGTITLIGTPPNLLISQIRSRTLGEPYELFDFAPVGIVLTAIGLIYLITLGRRLIPVDRDGRRDEPTFEIGRYITEVVMPERSRFVGRSAQALEDAYDGKVTVLGIVRGTRRLMGILRFELLEGGDLLLLQIETSALERSISAGDLLLAPEHAPDETPMRASDVAETVVSHDSWVIGLTASEFKIRRTAGVNLLAISRQGQRLKTRPRDTVLRAGDVLLIQGDGEALAAAPQVLGCLPLAGRRLSLSARRVLMPSAIFGAAILATALNIVPPSVAFTVAVLGLLASRVLPLKELYEAVDWPVIVLLGAMIPVGEALETTGTAQLLADLILGVAGDLTTTAVLGLVMLATMLLTPMLSNAATVLIMAPIAIGVASRLGVGPDPFLMAVAIGASCDFLTPFGHQNNTIILGPGGYRVTDFWRVGLILDVLIIAVGLALIPIIWPF